jgi:hypothetical protein
VAGRVAAISGMSLAYLITYANDLPPEKFPVGRWVA